MKASVEQIKTIQSLLQREAEAMMGGDRKKAAKARKAAFAMMESRMKSQ